MKRVYIADGHHRVAAASEIAKALRKAKGTAPGELESDWFLAVMFPDSELEILPYDRVVRDLNGLSEEEFLDELRTITQVIILSDTFSQFAEPLMRQLDWPTIFCNELIIDEEGYIADMRMRCDHSKLTTVRGLQSIGFETIAAGDSYNDLEMIEASKAGFLFRSTDKIKPDYPQYPAFEEFDEFLAAIKAAL
jgi:bifunctional phosphoserine phosphatase/homoserine phosphotransferase